MGKLITVQKTIVTQAVQINSPEEDAQVRTWLSEMFLAQLDEITEAEAEDLARAQDLTPITDAHAWFARDINSPLVYIIAPESFVVDYEEVDETEIASDTDAFKFGA